MAELNRVHATTEGIMGECERLISDDGDAVVSGLSFPSQREYDTSDEEIDDRLVRERRLWNEAGRRPLPTPQQLLDEGVGVLQALRGMVEEDGRTLEGLENDSMVERNTRVVVEEVMRGRAGWNMLAEVIEGLSEHGMTAGRDYEN
ncbi:MAG: hypothetical protein M1831_000033 [Alyxoria varia]|nr:MAG: hypothetical protein M1831_000033 [Alyxoria varia]